MRRLGLALLILLGLCGAAVAQGCGSGNPNCVVPLAPPGDSSNRAASTAWVQQNPGGTVNILAFGAKCDGSTDDHVALQNAINFVSGGTGGVVTIPANRVCAIDATVNLLGGVEVVGLGGNTPFASVLRATINFGANMLLTLGGNNIGISNLTLDGGNFNMGQVGLISFNNGNNVWVRHVNFINQGQFGVVLEFSTNFDISDNQFSCAPVAPSVCGTHNQNEGILSIDGAGAGPGVIRHNIFTGTGLEVNAHDTVIEDNTITGWEFGAAITTDIEFHCYNLTLARNVLTGGIGQDVNGVWVNGIESWCPNTVIDGNMVYNNAGEGIDVGGYNSIVTNNVVFDNGTGTAGLNGMTSRTGTATNFTGSITGTTLTVTGSCTGAALGPRSLIWGAGVTPGTTIVANLTGTGCAGTYTISPAPFASVASEAMTWSACGCNVRYSNNNSYNSKGAAGPQFNNYGETTPVGAVQMFGNIVDANNIFTPAGTNAAMQLSNPSRADTVYAAQWGVLPSNPDNTAAFQSILNFVASQIEGTIRNIQLPPGTLQFCSQQQWGGQGYSGLTIRGAGNGSSQYQPGTAGQGTVIAACSTSSGIIQVVWGAAAAGQMMYGGGLENMAFDGVNVASYGLVIKDAIQSSFRNLTFYRHNAIELWITNSTNSGNQTPTARLYFENTHFPLLFNSTATTVAIQCAGVSSGGAEGVSQNTFNHTFIDRQSGAAISVGEECDQETFEGNTFVFKAGAGDHNDIVTTGDSASVIGNWVLTGSLLFSSGINISCCTPLNIAWTMIGLNTGNFTTGITMANFAIGQGATGVHIVDQSNLLYNWPTRQKLGQSHIPFVYPSSGTMGNNGAFSAIAAVGTAYPNAYCYFPANAIAAGVAAGWRYCSFSSTTAGTVFNNSYTSGTPTIPASPTSFATTGPGAYTQTTSTFISAYNFTIPGNYIGPNGTVIMSSYGYGTSSANNKNQLWQFGGSFNFSQLTNTSAGRVEAAETGFQNMGVTNRQGLAAVRQDTVLTGSSIYGTIDTTVPQGITQFFNDTSAADTNVMEYADIELLPGVP